MKDRAVGWRMLLLLVAFSAVPLAATTLDVTVADDFFSPVNRTIQAGDSIRWTNTGAHGHNVTADDNSFHCANGCDDQGGDGNISSAAWTFTRTFNTPGTIAYYCENHGGPGGFGMSGTITVEAAPLQPGALSFTASSYSVAEAAGSASIIVRRAGGSDGAVSVHFATSNGTGVAGVHYSGTSGTLNWADKDAANKSFAVSVIDDGSPNGAHTVNLALSSLGGGATLGSPAAAVLTITNSDTTHAGSLRFSASSYSAPETSPGATITVQRVLGSDLAVSVHYATSNGTGTAGVHYVAASGDLNWSNGDAVAKTFTVPLLNDGAADGPHTVNLTLSSPGGGAALSTPSTAVLTVNDAGGPSPPAAPSDLHASTQSTSEIQLSWTDNSSDETAFLLEQQNPGGQFEQVVSLPADTVADLVTGLDPGTLYGFRVRAQNGAGSSAYSNAVQASTQSAPAACVPDSTTLCLNDGRFKVQVVWVNPNDEQSRSAAAVPLTGADSSGLFYFVDPNNIEMLVKVLNACVPFLGNKYWIFFAATTNVEFTLTVTDTQNGQVQVYTNPPNHNANAVTDTGAFATCP